MNKLDAYAGCIFGSHCHSFCFYVVLTLVPEIVITHGHLQAFQYVAYLFLNLQLKTQNKFHRDVFDLKNQQVYKWHADEDYGGEDTIDVSMNN